MSMSELGDLVTMIELRDYFAAKALQGLCAIPEFGSGFNRPYYEVIAEESYLIADAMLKERSK